MPMYPTTPAYLDNAMARYGYRGNNIRTITRPGFVPALMQYGSEAANAVATAGTAFAQTMGLGYSPWGDDPATGTSTGTSATPASFFDQLTTKNWITLGVGGAIVLAILAGCRGR